MTVPRRPIRIVLAEDQQMMRYALASLLDLEDDFEVVGQAGRGDEAVNVVLAQRPDVAVLDVEMPGMDGLEVAGRIAEEVPECGVLIVTAVGKPGVLQRALRAKARGFIVKHASADELFAAIRSIAAGQRVVDSSVAVAALESAATEPTSRELELARLLASGSSVRQIARTLHLSEGTVRNYTSNLMTKYGAQNRLDLVRIARDQGWV